MMTKGDFHIHSKYSYDSFLEPKIILKMAKKKGLGCIAVTDHNTIKGGVSTKKLAKKSGISVIVGSEIKTEFGDIIGLFLKKEIVSSSFYDVIQEMKGQGGIVVLPHPFRNHLLEEIPINEIDIIESFNARNTDEQDRKAIRLAKHLNKPILVGSDAHFFYEIGNASMNVNEDLMSTTFSDVYDVKRSSKMTKVLSNAINKGFLHNLFHIILFF